MTFGNFTPERLTRQTEPYHFQRQRHRLGEYPRAPQPGIQPNEKLALPVWGMSTGDYWNSVFQDYLKKRKTANLTNLGGLR